MERIKCDMQKNKTLKILAVGNSFSEDSVQYLYQIFSETGHEKDNDDIVIGNLVVGGCSLDMHVGFALENTPVYLYTKFSKENKGEMAIVSANATLNYGILDEDWDIITLQQRSGYSGDKETYSPYLDMLIDYINKHKTNKNASLAWNLTWAYDEDSAHPDFARYKNNQAEMYNAILQTVQDVIVPNKNISFVIPTGIAVQHARNRHNNLTRDGFHLSIPFGRYIAALTWFCTITNKEINDLKTGILTDEQMEIAKKSVEKAIINNIGR
ncbi:MAG: DUF4886 domain-containing protein [Clostridiaceae bacterium]|nr:DUF4886 domain-containing protein [Clostridiaceae bacterium]